MAKRILENIEVEFTNKEKLEYLERLFMEVTAKKDIVSNVFDLHKYDINGDVIEGAPFKSFMKEYAVTKFAYDQLMRDVQETCVPKEYQEAGCTWEVDFNKEIIKLTVSN